MISLIRKDLIWLMCFLIVGCTPLIFIFPLGLCLGVFAGIRDEITKTEEYLRCRSLTPLKIFTVRVIACLSVIILWFAWIFIFDISPEMTCDYHPVWGHIVSITWIFCTYTIGYFTASLRLPWLKRILIGYLTLVATSFIVSETVNFCTFVPFNDLPDNYHWNIISYLLPSLVFICVFIQAAYQNYKSIPDSDRPWRENGFTWVASWLVVFTIISSGIIFTTFQRVSQKKLNAAYPFIGEITQNKLALCKGFDKSNEILIAVNEKHEIVRSHKVGVRVSDRRFIRFEVSELWRHYYERPYLMGFEGGIKKIKNYCHSLGYYIWKTDNLGNDKENEKRTLLLYDPRDRLVFKNDRYSFGLRDNPQLKTSIIKIGKGLKNKPFYPHTRLVSPGIGESWSHSEAPILFETGANELWTCNLDKDEGSFKRLFLPEGDSYKSIEKISTYRFGFTHKDKLYFSYCVGGENRIYAMAHRAYLIKGVKGEYLWNGLAFMEEYEDDIVPDERAPYHYGPIFDIKDRDPIRPIIEAKDKDGNLLFSHQYEPHTTNERFQTACILSVGIIKAPALQVLSFLSPANTTKLWRWDIRDIRLFGFKRLWVIFINLLFAGALAFYAKRRLDKIGAKRSRCISWAIFILLGGLAVFGLYLLIETKRAYRKSAACKQSALLIQ